MPNIFEYHSIKRRFYAAQPLSCGQKASQEPVVSSNFK
jgi:hypothetical protein